MYHLSAEDIRAMLPYALICETKYGSRWGTGKRLKRWMTEFSEKERAKASDIFRRAYMMYLTKGVPDEGMVMSGDTLALWNKIGDFCASL